MKFSLEGNTGFLIHSYETGQVVVRRPVLPEDPHGTSGLEIQTRAFILSPGHLLPATELLEPVDFFENNVKTLISLSPELVLFGTGARLSFPDREILWPLQQKGIGVEVMDTGAACRTYNILVSEGRNVAAALLMIDAEE